MKKRTFIKLTSALAAGTIISPLISWEQGERLKNWAGNIEYSTSNVFYPASTDEVRELVKNHAKLKALGTRHCFNRIADSKDNLVSLKNLNKSMELDSSNKKVTIDSGITYGQLGPWLHEKGFALHNLASLPHISVAGACITATHGSGVNNQNLSAAVDALEFVRADGEVQTLSREKDGERFKAVVVGLGAIGVLTKLVLNVEPTYLVAQHVFEHLPVQSLKDHFEEILSGGYSVSLFTDWQTEFVNEVWVKSKIQSGVSFQFRDDYYGAKPATKNLHPIAELSAENCTEQMGVAGPWYDRLPHFKMGFTPSSGKELQAEYFVPHKHALEAILAVAKLGKEIGPLLMITEIRTIAADDLWMSPCFGQPCVTIHFTLKQDWPGVSQLLPKIEKALEPFEGRPHWGKLFTMSPALLRSRYAKMTEFLAEIKQYDPKGKFRNEFLDHNL